MARDEKCKKLKPTIIKKHLQVTFFIVYMKSRKTPSFADTYLTCEIKTDRNRVTGAIWREMKSAKKLKLTIIFKTLQVAFLVVCMKTRKTPSFAYTYLTWENKTDRNRATRAIWRELKSAKTKAYNQ